MIGLAGTIGFRATAGGVDLVTGAESNNTGIV